MTDLIQNALAAKRVGQYLIDAGVLTREQLDEALDRQKRMSKAGFHVLLGTILEEMGAIDQQSLEAIILRQRLDEGSVNLGDEADWSPFRAKIDGADDAGVVADLFSDEAGAAPSTEPEASATPAPEADAPATDWSPAGPEVDLSSPVATFTTLDDIPFEPVASTEAPEAPVTNEAPAAETANTWTESPVSDEVPAAESASPWTESPVTDEAPAAESTSTWTEAPVTDESPAGETATSWTEDLPGFPLGESTFAEATAEASVENLTPDVASAEAPAELTESDPNATYESSVSDAEPIESNAYATFEPAPFEAEPTGADAYDSNDSPAYEAASPDSDPYAAYAPVDSIEPDYSASVEEAPVFEQPSEVDESSDLLEETGFAGEYEPVETEEDVASVFAAEASDATTDSDPAVETTYWSPANGHDVVDAAAVEAVGTEVFASAEYAGTAGAVEVHGFRFARTTQGLAETQVSAVISQLVKRTQSLEEQMSEANETLAHLDSMRRYGEQSIKAADTIAEEIRSEAEKQASAIRERAQQEARRIVIDARTEHDDIVRTAGETAKQVGSEIERHIDEHRELNRQLLERAEALRQTDTAGEDE
ncbi:MAG TPA: DivIVA domain-containing protein [Chloroflexota bacterium]|jgi:hypothetical protein|nr:DivIVA domain-containing protein [Chloroflexota bacterium]